MEVSYNISMTREDDEEPTRIKRKLNKNPHSVKAHFCLHNLPVTEEETSLFEKIKSKLEKYGKLQNGHFENKREDMVNFMFRFANDADAHANINRKIKLSFEKNTKILEFTMEPTEEYLAVLSKSGNLEEKYKQYNQHSNSHRNAYRNSNLVIIKASTKRKEVPLKITKPNQKNRLFELKYPTISSSPFNNRRISSESSRSKDTDSRDQDVLTNKNNNRDGKRRLNRGSRSRSNSPSDKTFKTHRSGSREKNRNNEKRFRNSRSRSKEKKKQNSFKGKYFFN